LGSFGFGSLLRLLEGTLGSAGRILLVGALEGRILGVGALEGRILEGALVGRILGVPRGSLMVKFNPWNLMA